MTDGRAATSLFPDHFSGHASDYAQFRPDYPPALFDFLASVVPARRRAWDCATGNGQAAVPLAGRFEAVVATDASARQVEEAKRHPRVLYAVAGAEAAPLATGSVDLVTVAQALHWFDRPRFWLEADRVLVAGGVVAVWYYDLFQVSPEVDGVVDRFYREIVGPYWPPERALVEAGYHALEFPFEEIEAPVVPMEKSWTLGDLVGYVRTWSATRRYIAARGDDPLSQIAAGLLGAWGDPGKPRVVRWDLRPRVGRTPSPATIGG